MYKNLQSFIMPMKLYKINTRIVKSLFTDHTALDSGIVNDHFLSEQLYNIIHIFGFCKLIGKVIPS
jgi:hypothetical protein